MRLDEDDGLRATKKRSNFIKKIAKKSARDIRQGVAALQQTLLPLLHLLILRPIGFVVALVFGFFRLVTYGAAQIATAGFRWGRTCRC